MHNAYQGEVPFPLAGEGVVFRFKTSDLVRLRSIYGAPQDAKPEYDERGNRKDVFWQRLFDAIDALDPGVMVDLLKAGLKKPGGKEPFTEIDFDDLPFPLYEIGVPALNGLMVARWGKSLTQMQEEAVKAMEEADAAVGAAGPPTGPVTDEKTSTASSGPDGAPASRRTRAGT